METGNETVLKVVAAVVSAFIAGAFGMLKLLHSALSKKADKEQVNRHHEAIIDLYGKNEKVMDLIREKETRDMTRHIELLGAIGNIRK